jgi:thiamine biosynthesis lipoprotein
MSHWILNVTPLMIALGSMAVDGRAATPKVPNQASDFERVFFAMGTRLEISLPNSTREKALKASEDAYLSIKEAEARLSTWTATSELAMLNNSPVDQPVTASPALKQDLDNALACAKKTEFAFNPWIGPLVRAWGLRTGGRIPSDTEKTEARSASQPSAFEFLNGKIIKRETNAAFEEGGFGKGVGLDDAIASLRKNGIGEAVLNFGGQVSVLGKTKKWIAISDPAHRETALVRFQMSEGSVATSGNSEHGMQIGGRKFGHLLDPSTGEPAPFDGSTTVIAPKGIAADCMTKIFVRGSENALRWANQNQVEVLWIEPSKNPRSRKHWIAKTSCAWSHPLEAISAQVEIIKNCGIH